MAASSGIGSGLGGYMAIVAGESGTGSQYSSVFTTPTRLVPVKSAKGTYDPHVVQGGPYVRGSQNAGPQAVDLGSANVQIYLDAKLSVQGDVMNTGHALLLSQAMGWNGAQAVSYSGSQGSQMSAINATTAYALTAATKVLAFGSQANNLGGQAPVYLQPQDGCWMNAEVAVSRTDGTQEFQDYYGLKVTKAEYVFPRDNIVTYSMEYDAALVALSGTSSVNLTPTAAPVPFTMPNTSSIFSIWTPQGSGGATVSIDGCRKVTVTFTPKLATDRIYVGNQYKEEATTTGLIEVAVALEMDYTPTAQSDIFANFITSTSTGRQLGYGPTQANGAQGIQASTAVLAVGNQIAATGFYDTFGFLFPQLYLMSGGEGPLEGVDIIKNTIMLKGTLNGYNPAAYACLQTADSTF